MKRFYWLSCLLVVVFWVFVAGCATVTPLTIVPEKVEAETPLSSIEDLDLLADKSVIQVEDREDRVYITIINPYVTPKGKGDTKGKDLKPAAKTKIASALLHGKDKNPYFIVVEVKDNKAEFSLPNFAQRLKVPIVEHLWSNKAQANDGTVGSLLLNPNDPWVVYKTVTFGGHRTAAGDKADLKTLAIGILMYSNKPTVPLKSLGKGKLKQGRHPELQ